MDVNKQKAQAFTARLLGNPALKGLTPLQREEQILQFLTSNSNQLYPTLSSPSFFPGARWDEIMGLLNATLMEEIDKDLLPRLKSIIQDTIDLSFILHFRQQQLPAKMKEDIFTFIQKLLVKPDVRRSFTGPFSALAFNFADKYMNQIFSRKEYIHFELIKVQRLRMGREEIRNMINTSLLLRPVIHIMTSSMGNGQEVSSTGVIQPQYAHKVVDVVGKQFPVLPEQVIRSGVNSNVSFLDNKSIGATSRITALFSHRCRNYNPTVKVDRGADYPDKSWYSIARRNYKFYGFDVKMVDEFYKIAAENGW
jgi:hypothetical protein